MMEIIDTIALCILIGIGIFGSLSVIGFILSFGLLLCDENGKFIKLAEWSIEHKWCYPLYFVFKIAIGIIIFHFKELEVNITDNINY